MTKEQPYSVLVTGRIDKAGLELFEQEPGIRLAFEPELRAESLLEAIPEFDALVTRSETAVTPELLERAERLQVVARAAVGVNNIDVECATERGILVINTPGLNTNSAAELTMGLLIAVLRNLAAADKSMRKGAWSRHQFSGRELRAKTLGIIGLGNVGHRVARFAHGFEMRVLACDPYISPKRFEQHKCEPVDLETLCRESDIVTVHVPKTLETSGMIGQRQIGMMRDGVVILNAARGGIVDEAALLEGLRSSKVAGAGLDTWVTEPPKENPFADFPNVVMTPHIGASTREAQRAVGLSVATQTIRALRGEVVDYPVNMPKMKILEGSAAKQYTVLSERLGRFAVQCIDFPPNRLEVFFRGRITREDAALCRLAFLKGYLQYSSDDLITYVNSERRAIARGISFSEATDLSYTDYESSIRFVLRSSRKRFQVAGLVFSEGHIRITRVNDFVVEMELEGTLLVTINRDQPGMIGVIGTLLGSRRVNIDQFELARNRPGGEALALIRVDDDAPTRVLQELRAQSGIVSVKRIQL